MKFLSGGQYNGEKVPLCTYWSVTSATDVTQDYATIVGIPNQGQCIANAFFKREDITCFNSGRCNGEGKCLPCSKYKYGGMRLGITHSPPLEILRQFDGGLTEAEVRSPNLVRFPPNIVTKTEQNQTPYHILIKNIQAKIAKCCHWNSGDGAPSEFFLATIVDGPDVFTLTDIEGQQNTLKGIIVKNSVFPDDRGTFFPVGTTVVAGFKTEPSFYLEPRTGLVKPGEGVIFPGGQQPISVRIKQKVSTAGKVMTDTINATISVCNSLTLEVQKQQSFLDNANATNNPLLADSIQAKLNDLQSRQSTACNAASSSQTLGTQSNTIISSIFSSDDADFITAQAKQLSTNLLQIAANAETASSAGLGDSAARLAGNMAGILRRFALDVQQAGFRSFSKCEFFFQETNVAALWNSPDDGTLPCNGVRTDCQFYSGKPWKVATDENLGVGGRIKGEILQELRVRSDDWGRFDNPEQEFRRRFSTPFIWAFSRYVDISGNPSVEDMILYRPKVLLATGDPAAGFQTVEMDKVAVTNFTDFDFSKTKARIQPGSHTLNKDQAPDFPTLIAGLTVPTVARLSITHPRRDSPFIYRTWTPDKNKITLFGTGTPDATVFFVNETALRERSRYHDYLDTRNFIDGLPTSLPGSPDFTNIEVQDLQSIFDKLEDESRLNDSDAPLGYATATVQRNGAWRSAQQIDLVHNTVNKIYAFIIVSSTLFIFDSVEIDYRFLHSIAVQTSFTGEDFSMQDAGGRSTISSNVGDTVKQGEIKAETRQVVGSEEAKFSYGYYGARYVNRGLKNGTLNADNDLQPDPAIADEVTNPAVVTAPSTSLVTAVGYHVVQYRKTVDIVDWYVIDDCGSIMIIIPDTTANRVLPLPNQTGEQKPLSNILLNEGGKGSAIAQFGLETATISTSLGDKKLVQNYRDIDGFGLPANYIVLSPSPEVENAFGRANNDTDSISITYTYLQAQSGSLKGGTSDPVNSDEVVKENFYEDLLRTRSHKILFSDAGALTAGSTGAATEDEGGAIRDGIQEYVWVFADADGRPLGRKYSRFLVLYYGLSCINVEIYYAWRGSCTNYALFPDLFLTIGGGNGSVSLQPQGVTDAKNLQLGFRLSKDQIGSGKDCLYTPSCGDHEYLFFGGIRKEFEVTERSPTGGVRVVYVSAGAKLTGELLSSFPPLTDFNKRRGPVWYPYILCDPPRYDLPNSIGPLKTQSTELINHQTGAAGFNIGVNVLQDSQVKGSSGTFGDQERADMEAYRGVDLVRAAVLDIHTNLQPCTENYTYGNQVLDGRISQFAGASRKRGQVAIDIYGEKQWTVPPFGNLGRSLLFAEVSDRRGDYLTDDGNVAFRWMPLFPDRDTLGAGVSLFGENMEPQTYRLVQSANPAGTIDEVVNESSRFTQRALVRNQTVGTLEYPFVGFFPLFLSDNLLGKEPSQRSEGAANSEISSMWAWREQEKSVKRASDNTLLAGIKLRHPDYFLDNRGMEVRLRPDEGVHSLIFTSPRYNRDTGELLDNGSLKLDGGPAREIVIDFITRKLSIAEQENTVYDLNLELGEGPLACTDGTKPDNENYSTATCSCETDASSAAVNQNNFPSRFMHLDEVAPEGFFAIYEGESFQPPFTASLVRTADIQPCCQCVYYIRGMFASLDLEFLPTTVGINPVRDGRISVEYTWSRVPHGNSDGDGQDGSFNATEDLSDNYAAALNGLVFVNSLDLSTKVLTISEVGAIFPSRILALDSAAAGKPIEVTAASDLSIIAPPGGSAFLPVVDGHSQGETEPISLDFRFDGYMKISSVRIHFFAGRGWEVPLVNLYAVDPQFRSPDTPPTSRQGRLLAQSSSRASGTEFTGSTDPVYGDSVQEGLPKGTGADFVVVLTPGYGNQPFWNKYAMEFQLVFDRRSSEGTMGIAAIELRGDAILPDSSISESIETRERKYYISQGSPPGGRNPEGALTAADSATAYWRSTDQSSAKGANKYRAYGWGAAIEDDQSFEVQSDPRKAEELQGKEYDIARDLLSKPYTFSYEGFIPQEERAALEFYGGNLPEWNNVLTLSVSDITKLGNQGKEDSPHYGKLPTDRKPWSAPGHAWTYDLEENYLVCCPECPKSMVVNYNFAHLHDNLEVVQTAAFWDELPSGFTNLLRSTEVSPDPFFGQGASIPGEPGGTGQAGLLPDTMFQGVDAAVLEKAGFRQNPDGSLVRLVQGGE